MSDPVNIPISGNADELTRAVTAAFEQVGKQIDSTLNKIFKKVSRDFERSFNSKGALAQTQALVRSFESLEATIKAINRTTDGFTNSIENIDPGTIEGVNNQLSKLADLQSKLALGPDILGADGFKAVQQELRAVSAGLVTVRETALAAGRAQDEANRNIARDSRQLNRQLIQESKASTSRYVVDQQTQAAAARDSARKRVAIIQATARTIATIERGLSNIFRQTARVFSSAFTAAANTVSGVANGIGRAFTRTTTNIRNSVVNTNSEISRSYSKTFGDTTNTIRNETNKQSSIINNFAREAKTSISSISSVGTGVGVGLGAVIGGILGVGAARAITGGFERATILENSERALTKLLGTAERAKTLLGEVTDVVTGTPFRLDQFAAGATQLLAFNVEAEKIPEVLRTIGDAAALSIDPDLTVDRLIRTFGQIQAAGKLATEDINQLTEAGVPAWALLGNQLGKTTAEMRELVTDGAVPASKAIDLLLNGIQNGTDGVNGATVAFAGLSKELGTTLKGSVANFFTSINRLGANVFLALKEPISAFLGAATAAVDLLGSAIKTLAVEVSQSPLFQAIQRGLVGLTVALKEAKTTLTPFFEFISGGIVLLAQFAAAFVVFKNIPGALRAIGSAIQFILAPQRLLIAGLVLAASYFQDLYEDSKDLREALGRVGAAIGRIATVIKDLAVDAFEAFTGGVGEASDSAIGFSEKVLGVVVPALEKVSTFLLETVLPPIRRFARSVREDVLPVIGTVLTTALEKTKAVLGEFVKFVKVAIDIVIKGGTAEGLRTGGDGWLAYNGPVAQGLFRIRTILLEVAEFFRAAATILWKGDEYTEGTGWLSEDGLVIRGLNNIRAAMESVVNFTKNNLVPVLAGVGAAFGAIALTGSIPLAGLAGITTGIVVALTNDDIRNALVDTVTGAVEAARDVLENLVDDGTLGKIAANVLKAARKIGEVLGNILTDPRLLGLVAGIAAYAAALAGAFAVGLVEGVIGNIPEIVDGLQKVFQIVFDEIVKFVLKNPAIGLAIAGALLAAQTVRSIRNAGRQTGRILAQSVAEGTATVGGAGGGNRTGDLLTGLFGGPAAIQRAASRTGQKIGQTLATAVRNEIRLIQNLGGTLPQTPLGLERIPGESFADQNRRLAGTFKTLSEETGRLEGNLGKAAVAGTRFQDGLKQIVSGNIRQGIAQLGTAFKASAAEIGASAGAIAGGLFAASFVSQALLDVEASGKQKIQSALGTIAIGAGIGAQITGTPQGAAIGAAAGAGAAGLLFLVGLRNELPESEKAFKRAEEAAESFAGVVKGLADINLDTIRPQVDTDAITDAFKTQFGENLDEADAVAETLDTVGFKFTQLEELLNREVTGGIFFAGVESQLRNAGIEGEEFDNTINFLKDNLAGFNLELDAERARRNIFAVATDDAELAAGAADVAKTATDAFRAKVNELNEARLDGFRSRVDEARTVLNNAGAAADEAKEKLRQFLAGETTENTLQQKINDNIIAVGNLASSVAGIDLSALTTVGSAEFSNKVAEVQGAAANILADVKPTTPEAAAAALAPLKSAIGEAGLDGEVAFWLQAGIDNALTAYNTEDGKGLLTGLFDAEAFKIEAQTALDTAESKLQVALEVDPLSIPLIAAAAKQEFETVGADSLQGFADGFDGPQAKDAARTMGEDALKAAEEALDTGSPSKEFAKLGAFSIDGFVQGLAEGTPRAVAAGKAVVNAVVNAVRLEVVNASGIFAAYGRFLFDGFIAGMEERRGAVIAKATSIAQAAADAVANVLEIESPSKVFERLGANTMEGFAAGIESSARLVTDAAGNAVQGAIDASVAQAGGITVGVDAVTSGAFSLANQTATISATGGGSSMMSISSGDISNLARAIATETKPNVAISQTFTEPVDSRAVAADVAWRLT